MNDNRADIWTHNIILNSFSEEVAARVRPDLERVDLASGKLLYRSGEVVDYVYFPDRAMISVVAYTEDGQSAEVAVIGSEGATGLDVILGEDVAANEHVVQMADGAFRMKTEAVREEFSRCGQFQDELLHFTRKMIVLISQTALCNRLHSTEKRLSRWLLMCHDRAPTDVLRLTQEFIAVMLGANRTTVSVTAGELQNKGFISYTRGSITIVDRNGLEAFACACYETIRAAYGPLMR